ncbi:MAG: aminotransferase class I/II-fold pyridoxal phosphate-dependent enzyme [Promethearchaeota archaeon]
MKFTYIQKTPLYKAFSDMGRRIFLPDGIFYWSERAKKEAELVGTIGSAYGFENEFIDGGSYNWVPCYLEDFKEYSSLNIKSIIPYASVGGLSEVREVWKKWILKKSKYDSESDSGKLSFLEKLITTPIVTQGITNGLFICCSMLLNPGDYIILPNKRWGNYDNIINKFIGANIKSFEFFMGDKINVQGLKNAMQEVGKKQDKIIMLLNFPNNPTGYCPTKIEINEILEILKESQDIAKLPLIVLIDDAYEPFVYKDDVFNRSIFYDLLELNSDIVPIKLDGISKELLAYGGRVGFITIGLNSKWADNDGELELLKTEIINKLEGMIRSTISNTNHFYQTVTQIMFKGEGMDKIVEKREKVRLMLKKRFNLINSELNKINNPNISIDPNSGGFFLFVNLNHEKIKAKEFADHLLKEYKVGIIPIENLDENVNGIRIAYCSIDLNRIPELIKRINLAINDF